MDELKVDEAVKKYFKVIDFYKLEDGFEYTVDAEQVSQAFISLYYDIQGARALPRIKQSGRYYSLTVFPAQKERVSMLKPALLGASIAALLIYSYFLAGNSGASLFFSLPVLTLLALHETGRIIASKRWGLDGYSYMIPGIPAIVPFMGFITSPNAFPVNRDQQFDMGFISIVLALISFIPYLLIGNLIPLASISRPGITILSYLIGQYINFGNPLILGSMFAFTITFVNFLPTWQLDGGLMFDSVRNRSLGMDLLSVMLMSVMGFFIFALIIIFAQGSMGFANPLDAVTPLSRNRKKIYYALIIIMSVGFLFLAIF
ncbi:MAG: hypothetical protein QXL00_07525 [Conexivisphaerales archaeon]